MGVHPGSAEAGGLAWELPSCFTSGEQPAGKRHLAAGTHVMAHKGPESLAFDAAIARLKELDLQGSGQRYCGQRLAAQPGVEDAAIVADVSRQLGAGWLAVEEVSPLRPDMRIYRWQSQCSARFYALVTQSQQLTDDRGQGFRPMVSMYGCKQAR